jgi:ribosome-binding protein aMBF1 (putative translation factor)
MGKTGKKGDNIMARNTVKRAKFDLDKHLAKQLKNPVIKKAYDEERFMTSVMAEIYELRKKSGITQKELAKNINIPQSELSRIETGNQNITLLMLYRILTGIGRKPRTVNKRDTHAIAF